MDTDENMSLNESSVVKYYTLKLQYSESTQQPDNINLQSVSQRCDSELRPVSTMNSSSSIKAVSTVEALLSLVVPINQIKGCAAKQMHMSRPTAFNE